MNDDWAALLQRQRLQAWDSLPEGSRKSRIRNAYAVHLRDAKRFTFKAVGEELGVGVSRARGLYAAGKRQEARNPHFVREWFEQRDIS